MTEDRKSSHRRPEDEFDPNVHTLYQSCLKFLRDFGLIPSSESRKQFSSIYVGYYACIQDDGFMVENMDFPLADDYLDLDIEYCEGLEVLQFVHAIAKYFHTKLEKRELMPYGRR